MDGHLVMLIRDFVRPRGCLAAVKNNGLAMRFVSQGLCRDREVVYSSSTIWMAFEYVEEKFRSDREIAFIAVKKTLMHLLFHKICVWTENLSWLQSWQMEGHYSLFQKSYRETER